MFEQRCRQFTEFSCATICPFRGSVMWEHSAGKVYTTDIFMVSGMTWSPDR